MTSFVATGEDGSVSFDPWQMLFIDHALTFWAMCAVFGVGEVFIGNPRTPRSFPAWLRALALVVANQVLVTLPFGYVGYLAWTAAGGQHDIEWNDIHFCHWIQYLSIAILSGDVLFWSLHYACHRVPALRRIHAIHHEWSVPSAPMALYAHPLEHLFINLMSQMVVPLALGWPFPFLRVWIVVITMSSVCSHCNVHPFSAAHDKHHLYHNVNFGSAQWMDRIMGTTM